jgi:hypothetical protein
MFRFTITFISCLAMDKAQWGWGGRGIPQNPELDLVNTHKAPHLENALTLGLYCIHTCFEDHPSQYYFQPKIPKLYIYPP